MLDKIIAFTREILRSADFTCIHKQGGPADDASIDYLEEAFEKLGYKAPSSLLEFYRICNGFTLRWTYKKLIHPDYITSGDTDIASLDLLLAAIEHVPTEPILFDYVSDINQVMFRMEKNRITLLYHDEYLQEDFPMSIDVDEYFHLLDESRGLYPWRELFVKSTSFHIQQVLKDKFFLDLALLFKDADSTLFNQT